jgi:hypothetical protein
LNRDQLITHHPAVSSRRKKEIIMSNNADVNIDRAIAESIRENKIVIIEERIDTQPWIDLVNGLANEADDWARITGGDNRVDSDIIEVREYWGTDEDGDDWRVHVHCSR